MKTILLIHGPNLNRLGARNAEHYGTNSLADLEEKYRKHASDSELITFQSNHEGELIDFIQQNPADGIIINPGALTHYSYALHDALLDTKIPCVEVHLSDIKNRESWRKISVTAPACIAKISGKGADGYLEAIDLFSKPLNAVIGFPLSHSLSPKLHNSAYKELGINAVLTAMENEDINILVERIRRMPISLTAVTMPHKETIMPLLDEIDPMAKEIGAVNTVINKDGHLTGYNTDIVGIAFALRNLELKGKTAVLLGAGGAAKPVAHFLHNSGANLLIVNRDSARAEILAKKYGAKVIQKDQIPENTALIVNATPLGLNNESPLKKIPKNAYVFDLVYAIQGTPLLRMAEEHRRISGLDMFVAQGLERIRLSRSESEGDGSLKKEPDEQFYINLLKNETP